MKFQAPFIAFVLLTFALDGCSRQSGKAMLPQNNDFGVIEVSDGKPVIHVLADGRTCTITPVLLPDGNVNLTTKITETNGFRALTFEAPLNGRACTFGFDGGPVITVTVRR